jgi:MATE family multidrug resistance protein
MSLPSLFIKPKGLTPYPQGSLRELWQISFPLIISLMSASLMLFLDRFFLAHYSLTALNAAAHAGASVQFLQFWSIATVSIAEVFVGRYNGAGKVEKLGRPVWQMIWLALGTFIIYVPIGLFAGPYLFFSETYKQLEIEYFSLLTCFIPIAALSAALSAFYIGRGKVKFVTGVMLGSNLINVILDAILIFGFSPWIPPLGIWGAAWATGIALICQAMILFSAFFCRTNRQLYGTGRWRLNKRLFRSCVAIGLPNAVAHSIEIFAWVLIFDLMTRLGSDYMTVVTVAQSILFLFTFITEGLSKGATAIASNFIGAQQHHLVWKLLASGTKFYACIFLLLGGLLAWNPDPLISWFLPEAVSLSPATRETLRAACFWVWLYFLFDGISWLLIGLLTAAGDTRFVMKVGGSAPILFALCPVYLFVFQWGAPAHVTWMSIAFYALASGTIYLWRFRSEKWKEVVLA